MGEMELICSRTAIVNIVILYSQQQSHYCGLAEGHISTHVVEMCPQDLVSARNEEKWRAHGISPRDEDKLPRCSS